MKLTREIRFSIAPWMGPTESTNISNSWAGWPAHRDLAAWVALRCTVTGEVDADSGYLCNIADIDRAVRQFVISPLVDRSDSNLPTSAPQLLAFARNRLVPELPDNVAMAELEIVVSPYTSYRLKEENPAMVTLTHQFEFSAAHRLNNDQWSEEENQRVFGKCNNPHGHGHNYVVEVTVAGSPAGQMALPNLEAAVKELVIDRLDHKHLNRDVEAFSRLIPSVENIARVIWGWLVGQLGKDVELANIRVYETPKTWADYSEIEN